MKTIHNLKLKRDIKRRDTTVWNMNAILTIVLCFKTKNPSREIEKMWYSWERNLSKTITKFQPRRNIGLENCLEGRGAGSGFIKETLNDNDWIIFFLLFKPRTKK